MKRTLQAEHILIFSVRVKAEIRLWGPGPLLEQGPLLELLGHGEKIQKMPRLFREGIAGCWFEKLNRIPEIMERNPKQVLEPFGTKR